MNGRTDSSAALATSRFIHRKILLRLFLGWLFLSVAVGGGVLWLEVNRIRQFVHEGAHAEFGKMRTLSQLNRRNYRNLPRVIFRLHNLFITLR